MTFYELSIAIILWNVVTVISVYLGEDSPEVSFHHQGYLFLAPEDRAEHLHESVKMQRYRPRETDWAGTWW